MLFDTETAFLIKQEYAKRKQSTFFLTILAVTTILVMASLKKMTLCLKSKSEKTTVVKWNEGMNI